MIECVALKERNGVTTKGGRRVIFFAAMWKAPCDLVSDD